MQSNQLDANDAESQAGSRLAGFDDLITRLQPINRLPMNVVARLVEETTIEHFSAKQEITEIVRSSKYVHYLADGTLTLVGQDDKTERLDAATPKALKAIERRSAAYKKIVTDGPGALVKVPWELLENLLLEFAPTELPTTAEVEVSEILSSTTSNWMVRLLQSELFSLLPATNLQEILARLDSVPTAVDESIVKEGQSGDYFYIVESGQYLVTKKTAATGRNIKLATLGPGDSFGETALITNAPRCATVTTSQAGKLLKLDGEHFKRWMMDPVINRVSADEAKSLSDSGCQWIDVRDPAAYRHGSIPKSLNIDISVLRLNVNRLATDKKYIVCDSDPKNAALAAFLLCDRGFTVYCLDEPINEYCAKFAIEQEHNDEDRQLPGKNTTDKRDFSETVLGIGLTDLICELTEVDDGSVADESAAIAEPETNDIPANFNALDENLTSKPSVPAVELARQTTQFDRSDKVVALESRDKKPRQATAEPLKGAVPTAIVTDLSTAKDAANSSNHAKSPTADQLAVFPHSSLVDAPQHTSVPDIGTRLQHDTERLSRDMAAKIAELVNGYLEAQRSELEHEFENRTKAVKEEAVKSMRAHELKVAASYESREARIKENGQKLVAFANKLKRFKADLERSKKLTDGQSVTKAG